MSNTSQDEHVKGDTKPSAEGIPVVAIGTGKINSKDTIWNAAKKNDVKNIQKFLDDGVDVDVKNTDFCDETPLHYACVHNRFEAAMLLLENGAAVNVKSSLDQRTPLHYAAKNGNFELCEALLARGADPEAKDSHNCTPYMLAHGEGHMEVTKLLVSAGQGANPATGTTWRNLAMTFVLIVAVPIVAQVMMSYDKTPFWR